MNSSLFVVEGDTFYSPALNEMMRPLEAKKRRKKVQPTDKTVFQKDISLSEEVKGASESSCNTLVMNEDSSKRNKNKEDKKETSNKEKGDVAVPLAWERYVDVSSVGTFRKVSQLSRAIPIPNGLRKTSLSSILNSMRKT